MIKLIVVLMALSVLLIPAISTASVSGNYTIIESGLPAGTQWSYYSNGLEYTTTNNVVSVFGNATIIPEYSYNLSITIVGNIIYANYSAIHSTQYTIQQIIPYTVLIIFIAGILAVALVIKRNNNEY